MGIAQKNFEKISEIEGVIFYGKLKPSKCFKKDSPLKLVVKAQNTNDYPVNCKMKVSFFDTGLSKEVSEAIDFCIKANKTVKGKKKGLAFISEEPSNEEMKNDATSYEIYEAEVVETEKCGK
jgi:hypothetical protein